MAVVAEQQTVVLASQVEHDLRVADEREDLGVLDQLRHSARDEVLVLEHRKRRADTRHRRDLGAVETSRIDDDVAVDRVGLTLGLDVHAPAGIGALEAVDIHDSGVTPNLGTHRPRSPGQRLRQAAGIDIALIGVEQAGDDRAVVGPVRMHRLHLGRRDDLEIEPEAGRDGDQMVEVIDALGRVARPERPGVAIGDRVIGIIGQLRVGLPRVVPGALTEPAVGERRDVAGRVPRRTGGEFVLLDQNRVGASGRRQVPLDRRADGSTADDDNLETVGHGCCSRWIGNAARTAASFVVSRWSGRPAAKISATFWPAASQMLGSPADTHSATDWRSPRSG